MKAEAYKDTIKMCIKEKEHASIIALGPPGIGKTAIPVSTCKELEVPYSILRLNLVNPSDIRGMAYIAEVEDQNGKKEKSAVWAWPQMLPKPDGRTHVVILDDVTNSPTTVQSTAYGMVLEHMAGEHDLSHIRFISTGNRVEDASGAYALSAALLNRFERITLDVDPDEMKDYALVHNWEPMIPAFWRFQPETIHIFKPEDARKGEPFPTPRSWDMLSTAYRLYDGNIGLEKIGNYIGSGTGVAFKGFMDLKNKLPDAKAILRGESLALPRGSKKDPSLVYAMIGSLLSHYRNGIKGLSKLNAINNMLIYSDKLEADYAVLLVHDLSKIDMSTVLKAPRWKEWARGKAKYILGN